MSAICIPTLECLPLAVLYGQLLLGLINGSFYAILSFGLAVIFGMLRVVNFAHGAFYMLGAFVSWWLLGTFGVNYWGALILSPLIVALFAIVIERTLLRHLYTLDHLYGFLLTFGLAQVIEGVLRYQYGAAGLPYAQPRAMQTAFNLGFMFLPAYRGWVVLASMIVCLATWVLIEKTKFGAYLRAATENPLLVQSFGVNVPLLMTLTFGFGAALAAFAGVLAAPIYQVSPLMGREIIVVIFAVVVAGGMGSIGGAIATGYIFGLLEGLTKVLFPEASNVVVFLVMALVLLLRPAGLFGRAAA